MDNYKVVKALGQGTWCVLVRRCLVVSYCINNGF